MNAYILCTNAVYSRVHKNLQLSPLSILRGLSSLVLLDLLPLTENRYV